MREFKPIHYFWFNFSLMVAHGLVFFDLVLTYSFGQEKSIFSFTYPIWLAVIVGVINFILFTARTSGTIKWYRVIKFGIKSTWKD